MIDIMGFVKELRKSGSDSISCEELSTAIEKHTVLRTKKTKQYYTELFEGMFFPEEDHLHIVRDAQRLWATRRYLQEAIYINGFPKEGEQVTRVLADITPQTNTSAYSDVSSFLDQIVEGGFIEDLHKAMNWRSIGGLLARVRMKKVSSNYECPSCKKEAAIFNAIKIAEKFNPMKVVVNDDTSIDIIEV